MWNGQDHRAYLPTPDMLQAEDVLTFDEDMLLNSPSKFGVGLYIVSDSEAGLADATPLKKSMPLLYVSPKVAADRSTRSPYLHPGWYVCAEAGKTFEIHISPLSINACALTAPRHNTVLITTYVDGLKVSGSKTASNTKERIIRGFRKPSDDGSVISESFCFQEIDAEKDSGPPEVQREQIKSGPTVLDIGTIKVTFSGAIKGEKKRVHSTGRGSKSANEKRATITEKEQLKKGATIGVGGGKIVVEKASRSSFSTPMMHEQLLENKTIRILIRERYWLESRRIIDGDGLPATAAVARKGIGATRTKMGMTGSGGTPDTNAVRQSARHVANSTECATFSTTSHISPGMVVGADESIDVDAIDTATVKFEPTTTIRKRRRLVTNMLPHQDEMEGTRNLKGTVIVLD